MHIRVPKKARNFLTNFISISFSRRTVFHGVSVNYVSLYECGRMCDKSFMVHFEILSQNLFASIQEKHQIFTKDVWFRTDI